jgi:hypothetical protein
MREPREVEVTVSSVPEDLSGVLARSDHPNGPIISETQAEENARRMEKSQRKIEELIAAKLGRASRSEPESTELGGLASFEPELMPGKIEMPTGSPSQAGWQQFCQGDSGRLVERQAAQWVCQTLAKETLGAAGNVRIEFESDVPVSEVTAALERVTGSHGWQMLLRKAGLA